MFQMYGVIPPMVTPFKENGEVDYDALRTLVSYLKNEVNGLFICGSYGAGAMMTEEERKKILEVTLSAAEGKIPVVAHVGTADTLSACRLAKHAAEAGAAAVSAVGPYYFKHLDDDVCAYYASLLDICGGKTSVYVYNNPQFQGYPMSLGLLQRLKHETGINGVKDATFDILAHTTYMRLLKDDTFDVALGTEAMWLSACTLGCKAFIPGIGNAFPEICRKMFAEGMVQDIDACRKTQMQVNEMRDIMYLAKSTQLAIYAMLEIRGIVKCYPRGPFVAAGKEEKAAIRQRLHTMGMV